MKEPEIAAFWTFFLENIADLEKPNASPDVLDRVLEKLEEVDGRLSYHIGRLDDGQDVLISAEGHFGVGALVDEVVRLAPAIPGWGIDSVLDGSLLQGERDQALFPPDENGDVLYRIARAGDKVWRVRDVTFSLVFPGKKEALAFMEALDDASLRVEDSSHDGAPGFSHQVEIWTPMALAHEAVSAMEDRLGALAGRFGGRNDGWGSFQQR